MNGVRTRFAAVMGVGLVVAGLASCGGGASPTPGTGSSPATPAGTHSAQSTGARPTPTASSMSAGSLSASAATAPDCPSVLHFDDGATTNPDTAADGRQMAVHKLSLDAAPWLTSSSMVLRRGFADGSRIAWIEEAKHYPGESATPPPPGPHAPGKVMLEDCGSGSEPAVIASIPANDGELDLPVISGNDVMWVWWGSSGSALGAWRVSAYDTQGKVTVTVIQSGDSGFLPDPPSSRQPLVPSPQLDGRHYVTNVKTAEPDVSNIVVGSLASPTSQLITDLGPGSTPFAVPPAESAISGDIAAYVAAASSNQWNIWVYDFTTGESRQVTRTGAATGGKVVDLDPRLSGDQLAYTQTLQQGLGSGSVWLQDLSSGKTIALSPSLSGDGRPEQLAISSHWVVWETLNTLHFVPIDHPDIAYEVSLGDVMSGGVGTVVGLQARGDNITWTSESPDPNSPGEWASRLYWFRLPPPS